MGGRSGHRGGGHQEGARAGLNTSVMAGPRATIAAMDISSVQTLLNANGFPCGAVDGAVGPLTAEAVRRFQVAFNYGGPAAWLLVDGDPGPLTQAALARLPLLSEHFSTSELRSRGEAADGDCWVRRELLHALEALRHALGDRPLPVLDAYRNPAHNAAVGGAADSMHLWGYAADLPHPCTVAQAQAVGVFSGIGDKGGLVAHVDVRHLAGALNRTPGATPQAPARWHY